MKVTVDRDKCIGCGVCEATEPSVFQLDDDGISTVICHDFNNVDEEKIDEAVENCPTSAISKKD